MEIKPIRTKADYRATLKEIETLMSAGPRTSEGDRLDVLVTLVEAWERKHEPMDPPDPIEAIRFRMEQSGLTLRLESSLTSEESIAIAASVRPLTPATPGT